MVRHEELPRLFPRLTERAHHRSFQIQLQHSIPEMHP